MGPGDHRWERVGKPRRFQCRNRTAEGRTKTFVRIAQRWRCIKCGVECYELKGGTPRGCSARNLDGTVIHRMPPCTEPRQPKNYRHRWYAVASRHFIRWTCVKCGVEAETGLGELSPASGRGHKLRRWPGGQWERFTGPLGPCPSRQSLPRSCSSVDLLSMCSTDPARAS